MNKKQIIMEHTEQILETEGIVLNKECIVCYNNFINIKDVTEHTEFVDKITEKYKLTNKQKCVFEDETLFLCYDDRFQCNTCNNLVCRRCVWNTHQGIVCAKFRNKDGNNGGIRTLTEEEIKYIEDNCYIDIKTIIDRDDNKELWNIPNITIGNVVFYGWMRGTPGDDAPYKCPVCRQYSAVAAYEF